jgi:2'-5' RNA ligase
VTARLFFAVWPPAKAAASLHAWAREAQRRTGGRATRAEAIHLTLAFLGDVEEGRLEELRMLEITGKRHDLPIEQARYWPRKRIAWAGPLELPLALAGIAKELGRTLEQRSFRTEKRAFAAHVTLIRNARAPEALPPLPRVYWPVAEIALVRSRLSPAGPDYAIVQRYALA